MTRSYNVCEREVNMDSMPREDSRLSGRIGCSNFGTGDRLFGRDHLEDELDPVLSAAVRFNKSKSKGLMGLKYVLLCLIALLAIILLTIALFIIFSQSSSVSAYASNGENQEVRRVTITDEDKETERWTEAYQRNELTDVTHKNIGEEFLSPIGEVVDCEHFRNKGKGSGANQLSVPNYGDFYAYCEMESEQGWIVLQKRTSGKWPFWNASFDEYSYGFGDLPDGDHWLGLDRVSAFVESNRRLEMRIRLQGDFCVSKACSGLGDDGNWWGDWKFKILSRDEGYRITDLEYLRGNLSDPNQPEKDLFTQLCNNRSFTTVDEDNDENKYENCAKFRRRG
uniref:Fibrinogen C-terminal domain-containing protein n=1 Tax=Meloidogyne javanica TaxID=6303 RepID=A0A915M3X1_MELJA